MAVLYWQLAVFSTTLFAYLILSKKASLIVAILWSIWTFAMIYSSELIMIQLASAWLGFIAGMKGKNYVSDMLRKDATIFREKAKNFSYEKRFKENEREAQQKEAEIQELKRQLSDLSARQSAQVREARARGKTTKISGSRHYQYLLDTLKSARESVLILSGWISSSVVDDYFVNCVHDALRRGVTVYIGYGYENWSGQHEASHKAKDALYRLNLLQEKSLGLRGSLYVGRFNNHQKILLKDSSVVVCGSHNWLSNRAFKNHEKSIEIHDSKMAEEWLSELSDKIIKHREI